MNLVDLDLSKATMCSKQGGKTAVDGWVIVTEVTFRGISAVTNSGLDVMRCSQWPDCTDCSSVRKRSVLTEET